MKIYQQQTLREIQVAFHERFPNLKIEFFDGAHAAGEGSPAQQMLRTNQTIKEAAVPFEAKNLSFDENQTVKNFEQKLYEKFGLNVQVFRKSGNAWLQTTSTDHWTLARQNQRSRDFTKIEIF